MKRPAWFTNAMKGVTDRLDKVEAKSNASLEETRKVVVDNYEHLTEEMVANLSEDQVNALAGKIQPAPVYLAGANTSSESKDTEPTTNDMFIESVNDNSTPELKEAV